MSETLTLGTKNIFISCTSIVHVDYYPTNFGLENTIMHGAELNFENSTILQAIEDYLPVATEEIRKNLP